MEPIMKRTILIIVLLYSIYFQNNLLAQPVLEWSNIYAGVGNSRDEPVEMVISDSGNIYIGANSRGYLMLKYDPDGNLLWEGRAEDSSIVEAIAVDRWGNAVATGRINASHWNIYTARYANSDGHIIYSREVDPVWAPNSDTGWDVAIDSSGNAYITGWVFAGTHPNGTGNDWMTVVYPPLGDTTLWTSQYNGEENLGDQSFSIDVTPGGVVYIAGTTFKDSTNRLRIIKKNYWEKIYYLAPTLDLRSTIKITVTEDEDIYVTAHMGHHEEKDAYLIKHDSSGNHEWTRTYNGPDNLEDYPVDLAVDNEGNVIVLCFSQDANNQESMATLKYSPEGDTLWMKRHHFLGSFEPKALAVDSENNVYALDQYNLIKYNSNGNEQWVESSSAGSSVDIALDNQNNIYVTGYTGFDIITVKYSQVTGINDPGSSNLPTEFNLLQNYPNPFNPSTKISFVIGHLSFVNLKVYDVLGNEVATLVNKEKPAGEYEVEFTSHSGEGRNLSSGIYFYQLRAGSFIQTKKMILAK
jgi:Secretion system C-terminal sorting domain